MPKVTALQVQQTTAHFNKPTAAALSCNTQQQWAGVNTHQLTFCEQQKKLAKTTCETWSRKIFFFLKILFLQVQGQLASSFKKKIKTTCPVWL